MSLFSAIGGLLGLGGSSTEVAQTTQVGTSTETNVNVQNTIQNLIDTSGLERVLQSIRELFAQSTTDSQQLFAQSTADNQKLNEQTALIFLAQAQSDAQKNDSDIQRNQAEVAKDAAQIQFFNSLNDKVAKSLRVLAIGGGLYVLYRVLK